jgi:2-oxoisovalerate dehydrogenase E2 component (dihydrolipoyl transacylase)
MHRSISRIAFQSVTTAFHSRAFGTIVPFKLADIGEGIAEVELMKWFVKKGDKIKAFDKLCEVQSDKATVEITSRFDGVVTNVHHDEGSIVKVGAALVDIETDSAVSLGATPPHKAATPPQPKPAPASIPAPGPGAGSSVVAFKLADIGEGIAEVELLKWYVKAGDKVKAFDKLCEVQSDKATVEITSRYDGVIASVHHKEGSVVKVGEALVDITTSSAGSASVAGGVPPKAAPSAAAGHSHDSSFSRNAGMPVHVGAKLLMTPAVRKLVKENKVDMAKLTGSGPKGRILKQDVLAFLSGKSAAPCPAKSASTPEVLPKSVATSAQDTVVPIRGIQRMMVKSMTAANQVPHLTYSEEIIFDEVVALRDSFRAATKASGVKMSFMPILIKAASLALRQYPQLNATINADATEMTIHASHNIGIAMDTPKGLIVPVLKGVQDMSIIDISVELSKLQEAAQKGSLTEAQLQGGTFSLSNIGSVGGTYAVPVLVVPQVVIGAFGRSQMVPRYVDENGRPASNELIRRLVLHIKYMSRISLRLLL